MLRKRTWEPTGEQVIIMSDPPEGWRIIAMLDIDPEFERIGGNDEDPESGEWVETAESKATDRTLPWIVIAAGYGQAGPRHARIGDAMAWAEDFAEDIETVEGSSPDRLGITRGSC